MVAVNGPRFIKAQITDDDLARNVVRYEVRVPTYPCCRHCRHLDPLPHPSRCPHGCNG